MLRKEVSVPSTVVGHTCLLATPALSVSKFSYIYIYNRDGDFRLLDLGLGLRDLIRPHTQPARCGLISLFAKIAK